MHVHGKGTIGRYPCLWYGQRSGPSAPGRSGDWQSWKRRRLTPEDGRALVGALRAEGLNGAAGRRMGTVTQVGVSF